MQYVCLDGNDEYGDEFGGDDGEFDGDGGEFDE